MHNRKILPGAGSLGDQSNSLQSKRLSPTEAGTPAPLVRAGKNPGSGAVTVIFRDGIARNVKKIDYLCCP
ncbi:MAG: hypothetical protein AB7V25_08340 [Mangrovibacterium sp.]